VSRRDWSKPRVDAVRGDVASVRRVESIMDERVTTLCEHCMQSLLPGEKVRRVNAKESPSGEGGYVHDPTTCRSAFAT
jgi:hypothetical protein